MPLLSNSACWPVRLTSTKLPGAGGATLLFTGARPCVSRLPDRVKVLVGMRVVLTLVTGGALCLLPVDCCSRTSLSDCSLRSRFSRFCCCWEKVVTRFMPDMARSLDRQQRLQQRIRRLQHARRGLVGVLVDRQVGQLLIDVDAGD